MPKTQLPKAYGPRGADMGRWTFPHSADDPNTRPVGTLRAHWLPLDSGGYDSGGAYWGHGGRLYRVTGTTKCGSELQLFYRAHNRADAIRQMRQQFPFAGYRFFGEKANA